MIEDPCLRCGKRHVFERCADEIPVTGLVANRLGSATGVVAEEGPALRIVWPTISATTRVPQSVIDQFPGPATSAL